MGEILKHYMEFVPTVNARCCLDLPCGSVQEIDDTRYHPILLGGDQLTVARVRGTQDLRDTQPKRCDRFEGLVPVVEDWHARMTLLKVHSIKLTLFYFKFVQLNRLCGIGCTAHGLRQKGGLCTS